MDPSETLNDKDSGKTVILWKNKMPPFKSLSEPFLKNVYQRSCSHSYKVPTRMSEHFLNSAIQTSEDFVNEVIEDSKQAVQCYLQMDKLEFPKAGHNDNKIVINKNAVQACKDKAKLDSNHSLFSNLSWLNENGIFDDQVAIENISDYIKQHWKLEQKYLYTIEKSAPKKSDFSCHRYKAEFSVPTNEYPIPQVTVSAFFTVSETNLLSLPTVYIKYQLEMDRHVYVVGRHSFNKTHFERQFKIKRDLYMNTNKYTGWSSSGPDRRDLNS